MIVSYQEDHQLQVQEIRAVWCQFNKKQKIIATQNMQKWKPSNGAAPSPELVCLTLLKN